MDNERSSLMNQIIIDIEKKFDYFILGLIIGLLAYISQSIKNSFNFGINQETGSIFVIFFLLCALITSLYRIKYYTLFYKINLKYLETGETLSKYNSAVASKKEVRHSLTGKRLDKNQALKTIDELTKKMISLEKILGKYKARGKLFYKLRNLLLILSFVLLIATKLLLIIEIRDFLIKLF